MRNRWNHRIQIHQARPGYGWQVKVSEQDHFAVGTLIQRLNNVIDPVSMGAGRSIYYSDKNFATASCVNFNSRKFDVIVFVKTKGLHRKLLRLANKTLPPREIVGLLRSHRKMS
jgi:hypothetical protein